MAEPDVLIVGGGIIGAACARALALRDISVTVLESGPEEGAATPAAAGMLAPFFDSTPDDPLLSLAVRARDLYGDLAPILKEETQVDIDLWTEGIVQIAFTEEEMERAKGAVAWQRQSGFAADWLSIEELRERVHGVADDVLGGALAPEDGALDPSALLTALFRSAEMKGATVITGERVDEVLVDGDRATGVRTSHGTRSASAVLIAAGCWSGRVAGLPRPLSVEPMRGQLVALRWPEGQPRAIVYGSGGYVLERSGEAIAGTTMENAGYDPAVTDEGVNQILRFARRTYPALERAAALRSWAGLRPSTPDGRPALGPDPAIQNLWYATGHGRSGILFAALTGDLLTSLYLGEEVPHDLTPMNPARFWAT